MLFRNHTCKSFCVRINCKPGHKFLILPKQTWSFDTSSSYFTKNTFVIFCYGIVFHHILGHILKIAFPVLERLYVSSAITYHEMAGGSGFVPPLSGLRFAANRLRALGQIGKTWIHAQ